MILTKHTLTIFLVIFVFILNSSAQNEPETTDQNKNKMRNQCENNIIIYDAKLQRFIATVSSIREGSGAVFMVKNINPFLYNVLINRSLLKVQASISDEYNLISLPKKETTGISTKSLRESIGEKFTVDYKEFEKSCNEFEKSYFKLYDFNKIGSDLQVLIQSEFIDSDQIHQIVYNIIKQNFSQEEINSFSPTFFRKKSDKLYASFFESFDELEITYNALNIRPPEIVSIYNSSELLRDSIIKIGSDTFRLQAEKSYKLYYQIMNESFTRSLTVQATSDADIIVFKPQTISKEKEITYLPEWEVYITNGFRIDFSTGLVLSWLVDDTYTMVDTIFYKQVPSDSTKEINGKIFYKNDQSEISFGIAGLTHCYYRFSKGFGLGANLGISINTTLNPQFLAGLSLLFGPEQRLVINVGAALGKVQRLASPYEESTPYEFSQNTVPYTNVYKIAFYLGLTYSIGGRSVNKE